ncbi:MAG: ATP-dependent RecD-like DNA helicase [Clostridia bacterium]|nr:ATP-dependent RecD-like DNA helicase [Clostridia bacterium]
MSQYRGLIKEVVFRNEESGYSVVSVKPEHGEEFTAVGILPFAQEGDYLDLTGEWVQHATYGEQLKVASFEFCQPTEASAIEKYLGSGAIDGVGATMAKRITRHFGKDTLSILDNQPERIIEVNGIGRKTAKRIIESYQEKRESQGAYMFFMSLGISPSLANKIYTAYGRDSIIITRTQPYRLAEEIRGVGFRTADKIALMEGYALSDERRLGCGIKFVLNESLNGEGHTYLPENVFLQQCADMLSVPVEAVNTVAARLIMKNELVYETVGDITAVFLKQAYECEVDIAARISRMCLRNANKSPDEISVPDTLPDGTVLSQNQKAALATALSCSVTVITGGPGTGKTTLIRGIIDFTERKGTTLLCAPTGRAAKRMSEATGREAKTIHRLLEYGQGGGEGFAKNEDDRLEADTVIVDETSMVDIFLMRALLKALVPKVRLILVGDADQLPSVGAGNVLKDLISSGTVPVVRLTEVFRQSEQSAIVMNAHRINRGEMPVLNAKNSDFFMEKTPGAAEAAQSVTELVMRRLPKYMDLDPLSDIQVMSPMKRGEVGVIALNKLLQQRLNPPGDKKQLLRGETCFRAGDKVMQTKNDYSLGWVRHGEAGQGVFNGDIGYVTEVDTENNSLTVRFDDDRRARYEKDMLDEIDLAYCMSVHKSQGSEFKCVVMPLISGPPMLMTRNLLYTAVTRARKLVVLTGRPECVYAMVQNDHIQARYSYLAERLRQLSGIKNNERAD